MRANVIKHCTSNVYKALLLNQYTYFFIIWDVLLFRPDYGERQGHLDLVAARVSALISTATSMLTGEVSYYLWVLLMLKIL